MIFQALKLIKLRKEEMTEHRQDEKQKRETRREEFRNKHQAMKAPATE